MTLLPRLEKHADFAGGWFTIGEALLACGQPAAASSAVMRGMRALEGSSLNVVAIAEAHHLHGRTLRATRRDADASAAFEAAVAMMPRHADAWFNLGLLHQDRNRNADAARSYRMALLARPDFHEAALNLGVALGDLGQLDEAIDAYAAALAIKPDSFGRIAQALTSGRSGMLVLDPARLREILSRPDRDGPSA